MQTMRMIPYQRPRAGKLRAERRDESATLVRSLGRYATPTAPDNFDEGERRAIQTSLHSCNRQADVDWLIDLFVMSTRYVPLTARRLLEPTDLPPSLERVAGRSQQGLQTWFAWTDGPRVWFLVTEMATIAGPQAGETALRVFFYDEDGRFVCWGTWALQSGRGWLLLER